MLARLLLLSLFMAAPAQAKWLVAETEHFRLHEDTSENRIRERAALLEDYRSLLVSMTNVGEADRAPAPRLNVYVLKNIADARPFGKLGANVAGIYIANPGGVAAFANNGVLGIATVLHEYAHHFMLAAGSTAYPAWYVEGFAEYFMTAEFRPEKVEFGNYNNIRAAWLVRGLWLPLEKVLARSFRPKSSDEVAMFYAQSWLLTHYLYRVEGEGPKLQAYLRAVAQGADAVEAFKTHIGPNLGSFQSKLKAYLTSRRLTYSVFKRPAATPASVQIATLSPAANDLLMPLVGLELAPDIAPVRESAAQIITKAAAKHPDDPMAARALALLALRFGKPEDAAARLDTLLEATPEDPTLLLWRAQSLPQATPADRAQALRYLVKSYKANPDDWRTLRAYALARGAHTQKLSENDLDVLSLAWELAPQVDELALDLAIAFAHADKLPQAARVLAAPAANPHGSALKPFAQRLLEAAAANDKPAFFAALTTPQPEEQPSAP
jgi:hypothetical protein